MAEIFISYARADAAFAARLKQRIEAAGLPCWMDTSAIAAGETWTEQIEAGIQAARCVLVVVSKASTASSWVRREILYAQQLGRRIVPVMAEPVQLPALLIDLNSIDLADDWEAGIGRLIAGLQNLPAGAAAPARPPAVPRTAPRGLRVLLIAAAAVVFAHLIARGEGRIAEIMLTGLIVSGALLAMAWKADEGIGLQFRRDLSLWLEGLDPMAVETSVQRWPHHFAALFDRLFGKRHFSWRCFLRSTLASMLSFVLVSLITIQASPAVWAFMQRELGLQGTIVSLAIAGVVVNIVPDYVSLLETRWLIRGMQKTRSLIGQLAWLLLDLLFTAIIAYLAGFAAASTLAVLIAGVSGDFVVRIMQLLWIGFIRNLQSLLTFEGGINAQGMLILIPFLTTFLTSAWAWLYFVAQFLMRLSAPLRRSLGFLQYALPIEHRPLRAVGVVMALVAFAGYLAVMLPFAVLSELQ